MSTQSHQAYPPPSWSALSYPFVAQSHDSWGWLNKPQSEPLLASAHDPFVQRQTPVHSASFPQLPSFPTTFPAQHLHYPYPGQLSQTYPASPASQRWTSTFSPRSLNENRSSAPNALQDSGGAHSNPGIMMKTGNGGTAAAASSNVVPVIPRDASFGSSIQTASSRSSTRSLRTPSVSSSNGISQKGAAQPPPVRPSSVMITHALQDSVPQAIVQGSVGLGDTAVRLEQVLKRVRFVADRIDGVPQHVQQHFVEQLEDACMFMESRMDVAPSLQSNSPL
eukprot:ANDGO_00440.mRNA.1 hypothetical protein